jgi:2-hydroxy-3-keto-5-methylthiopentenyl-1-phosphate phosphatase
MDHPVPSSVKVRNTHFCKQKRSETYPKVDSAMINHGRSCHTTISPSLLSFSSSVTASQVNIHRQLQPRLSELTELVTDMSAAKHADVLFVKQKEDGENDLHTYCDREGIKHVLFSDFGKALPVVQSVVEGQKTVAEVLEKGTAP